MAIRSGKYPQLADEDWLREQYVTKGKSCPEIAAELGCNAGTVEYRLKRHGIQARGRYPSKWKPKTCAREGCGRAFTPSGPAQKFCSLECRPDLRTCAWAPCAKSFRPKPPKTAKGSVYSQKFCSFECRQAHWAQTSAHRWVDKTSGYVFVTVPPTMSQRTTKGGYVELNVGEINANGGRVAEHRWVMEQRLDRRLYSHERVHHKNGHRAENDRFCPVCEDVEFPQELVAGMLQCPSCGGRLKPNLELWTVSQPAGQRVEDKIEWALWFLAQYGYEVSQLAA